MNPIQSAAFDNEIARAKEFIATGDTEAGFTHLERAHVIGQAFVVPHVRSHCKRPTLPHSEVDGA